MMTKKELFGLIGVIGWAVFCLYVFFWVSAIPNLETIGQTCGALPC